MDSFGNTIRKQRAEKDLPLRVVAAYIGIDQAILSKIETGKRKASRETVVKLADFFKISETDLLLAWLAEKLIYEAGDEEVALKAMQVAEEAVAYKVWKKQNHSVYRKSIKEKLEKYFKSNTSVHKAWVFGSFARGDDTPKSDIDVLIDIYPEAKFTLMDIAGIQHELETAINRKVDLVMLNGIRPEVKERVQKDMELIYEAG